MLHQADEEGQVVRIDALFIEGEDEAPALAMQQEIGVFDAFGYALEGQDGAEIVSAEKGEQRLVRDIGINSHGRINPWPLWAPPC